jgi:hypothetical protein
MADLDVHLRIDTAVPPLDLTTIAPTVYMLDSLLQTHIAATERWAEPLLVARCPYGWPQERVAAEYERLKTKHRNVLLLLDSTVTELTEDDPATTRGAHEAMKSAAEATGKHRLALAAMLASALKGVFCCGKEFE